ncbi:MAG: hypothetical protein CMJ46_12680 [Planctomyces sp.]|nr:hypothetical protein [Planctomyces sp.]
MMTCLQSILTFALMTVLASGAAAAEKMKSIKLDESSSGPHAVVVHDQSLVHTGLILPVNESGRVVSTETLDQLRQLGQNARTLIESIGSGQDDIVLFRVHCATRDELEFVRQKPAGLSNSLATYLISPLPDPEAKVGMEVIFASDKKYDKVAHLSSSVPGVRLSVLPRGRAVYISGQLEQGNGTVETARLTMEGLHRTLTHIGLDASHVVHIRTFLAPMSKAGEVDDVIDSFYPEDARPAVTHLEWKTTDSIEIEMIAWVPDDLQIEGADPEATVQHFWLPWLTVSPVYCRYTLVISPDRIYVRDLIATDAESHEDQIHAIFGKLKKVLEAAGSDLEHLAKATYYTTNAEVSKPFGQIRPEYYSPEHPPAASLARIEGIEVPGKAIAIDMLAVPAKAE